jgi:membrane-bound lytic murein transglycosylase MltF
MIYIDSLDLIGQYISDGKADFGFEDSQSVLHTLQKHEKLNVSMPISPIQEIAWAVHKKNKILEGIIIKYLKYAKAKGIINDLWIREYGISLSEYESIIMYE